MAYPVLEFDPPPPPPPQKKEKKENEKLQSGSRSILLESQRCSLLWIVLKQKFIGIRKNKRIRNLVSEEIEKNWSILKKNFRQKDIWEKVPISYYFELRIVTRSLSGYLEQGQSCAEVHLQLEVENWKYRKSSYWTGAICKYYMNN